MVYSMSKSTRVVNKAKKVLTIREHTQKRAFQQIKLIRGAKLGKNGQ